MRSGWWYAVAWSLCLAGPAAAQVTPADNEIVVKGGLEDKKSDWKRAETDHVIVYSDGSAAELARVTNNLERLYTLMTRLYRKGATADETAKLQVTLFDSADFYGRLGLSNTRLEEGPFTPAFYTRRYYDPRDDGALLAVSRSPQIIKLHTIKATNQDCDEARAEGAEQCTDLPYRYPVARKWQAGLYSAFAQHFILTYTHAVYPRWYIDGIGMLFSTIDVRRDGTIDYAGPPGAYKDVFRAYGDLDVEEVLTGRYLEPANGRPRQMDWTPYHAWLLTHFFVFSNPKPDRMRQFRQYMAAIHNGAPMAEAAKAFGDMRELKREVRLYAGRPIWYARTDKAPVIDGEPLVSNLSLASAAVIETRIQMGSGKGGDWLTKARARVENLPFDAEAMLVIAEAECRARQPAACLASADRVLARAPGNARALTWKGIAQTDLAIAGPRADRPGGLAEARGTIERAIQLDGQAPLPLIAWFQSFTKIDERVPQKAMLAMARAVQLVPAAARPRLYLAEELIRQGDLSLARQIIYPVLYGIDDMPERRAAQTLMRSTAALAT